MLLATRFSEVMYDRGEDLIITGGPGTGVHRVVVGGADTGTVATYLGVDVSHDRPILCIYDDADSTIDVDSTFTRDTLDYIVKSKFVGRWANEVTYVMFLAILVP